MAVFRSSPAQFVEEGGHQRQAVGVTTDLDARSEIYQSSLRHHKRLIPRTVCCRAHNLNSGSSQEKQKTFLISLHWIDTEKTKGNQDWFRSLLNRTVETERAELLVGLD